MTVTTLAEDLGVSLSTISNAYNRPTHVSPALRQAIFDRARELGYAGPHAGARSLRTGKALAVGLVFSEELPYAFADPAITKFLEGLSEAIAGAGMNLLIVAKSGDDTTALTVRNALVDGLILYSMPVSHPAVEVAMNRNLPIISVDDPRLPSVPLVAIDDRAAASAAAEHLIELGHTRLAVLVFDPTFERILQIIPYDVAIKLPFGVSKARLQGYADACKRHGVPLPVVAQARFNTEEAGNEVAQALFSQDAEISGLLCTSDLLAFGALAHLEAAGIRVPERVSVIGFDGLPKSSEVTPRLTTIRQPLRSKGHAAGQLLVDLIAGKTVRLPVRRLEWALEVRGTTADALRTSG